MFIQLSKNNILTALNILNISYKQYTDSIVINCIYHSDKNPSMSIKIDEKSPIFGLCKCFSCGKTTSIQKLIKDISGKSIYDLLGMKNINDYTTFQFLNSLNNYNKKIDTDNSIEEKKVFNIEGKFYKLKENTEAYNYLVNIRKINKKIIKEFEINFTYYCEINKEENIDNYGKKQISKTIFKNRLCIPIYHNNQLVNIEGRDYTQKQLPKVLYPRKTLKPLFNYNNLDKNKPLYLNEGILNMFGIYEYIDKNTSALLGNQPNNLQIKQLNEFKEIILIPDNDLGSKTLLRILDENYDGDLYIAKLDDKYNDVNDVIKDNNINHLYKVIQNKKLYMEKLLEDYNLF